MLYRVNVLYDPSGEYERTSLPEFMSLGEVAFCFDTQKMSVEDEVEKGGGCALIIDELTGATVAVVADGAEEIGAQTLAAYARESRRIGEDGR